MKKRLITLLLIVMCLALVLTACEPSEEPTGPELKTITAVLNDSKNNDEVKIEGVVYGVVSNGFYMSDSADGRIYVMGGENIKYGDKVTVEGKFSLLNDMPQIKNATVTVVESGQTANTVTSNSTIADINKLDSTARVGSYGAYYTVVGTVTKDGAGRTMLVDEQGESVLFNNYSNQSALDAFLNKRVTISVITHSYSSVDAMWKVSFVGSQSDIIENPLTLEQVKEVVLKYVEERVGHDVYGVLSLVTEYPLMPSVELSWSVEENPYISIADNKATVTTDESDHDITLKLTIKVGDESETIDYNVKSHAIVEQTLGEMLDDDRKVSMSKVIVTGVVVSLARNQSLSLRSYVLMDETTNETITVDFSDTGEYILNTSNEFKSVQVGDRICVEGQFRNNSTDRWAIVNITSLEVRESNVPFELDKENAVVLETEADYQEFGANMSSMYNRLVKIVNPYVNYSTSTVPADTNWVRFGGAATSVNKGYGTGSAARYFAFLIAAQNENLGSDLWHTSLNIPFINNAEQRNVEIYAFAMYLSDSYLAFIIPDQSCYKLPDEQQVEVDIKNSVPSTIDTAVTTSIELMKTHSGVEGEITWTSDNAAINTETGAVTAVSENTQVTLTATYKVAGEEKTLEITVTLLASGSSTVTEVLENAADGTTVRVSGIVIGYMSDGNSVATRMGYVLMDETNGNTILVNGPSAIGGEYGAYIDSNGQAYGIGDRITVTGTFSKSYAAIGSGPAQENRVNIDLSSNGIVVLKDKDVEFTYNFPNAEVIDSTEDLANLAQNLYFGKVIKFVGTEEAPIYVGYSSSSMPVNVKILFNGAASSNDDTKFVGPNGKNYTFSLKTDTNAATAGADWYTKAFGLTEDNLVVRPKGSNLCVPIVGEVYVVVSHWTSTYFQMNIVAWDECTLEPLNMTDEDLESEIMAGVPDAAQVGELFDLSKLPSSTYHTTGIIWAASPADVIDLTTGVIKEVTENTTVTLTATYTYKGTEKTATKVVTVFPAVEAEPLTVTEAVAQADGATISFTGIVVGFTSETAAGGDIKGLILSDGANILMGEDLEALYLEGQIVIDGHTVALGDEITFKSVTLTNTASEVSFEYTLISKAEIGTTGNSVTWGTEQIAISSDADLEAFAANPKAGVLIKLTGDAANPFFFSGSSSDIAKINFKFHYKNTDSTKSSSVKYNDLLFAFKGIGNTYNAGAEWWSEIFGLPGAFVGPNEDNPANKYGYTGTMYCVLTAITGTYYQLSFVNADAIAVTPLTAA